MLEILEKPEYMRNIFRYVPEDRCLRIINHYKYVQEDLYLNLD